MVRISVSALEFALKHVERYGDTDILPGAFEFEAIRWSWDEVQAFLTKADLDIWTLRPLRKCLSPKGRLGYRIATQLDPLDTLLLTALVYEIGHDVERARTPQNDYVVLSHRFQPDSSGRLYSKQFTYETFRQRSLTMASNNQDGWIVLTDIADFYPRIYTHRLENALREVTLHSHARVLKKLVTQWNQGVSYGIPVGLAATRLLAELCIADIDSILQANQVVYCRYSDDFRLFASTRSQALGQLALLASALYKNHGLTLQEAKTEVISTSDFISRFHETDAQRVRSSLQNRFLNIVDHLGIDSYDVIEYDDLDSEQREAVDELNLQTIVLDQVTRNQRIDIPLFRFALRRLNQIGGTSADLGEILVSEIDRLTPVFPEVIAAFVEIKSADPHGFRDLIQALLGLLDNPFLSHLEYYRVWLLTLFGDECATNYNQWQALYEKYSDPFTRRNLILTMGAANEQAWIRMHKDTVPNLGAWERRAFLRAASCLPKVEAKHWFRFVSGQDKLDQWIVKWAKKNPVEASSS